MNQKLQTIYLDESGVASITDDNSKYFVLAGIVVDNNEDIQLSGYFNFIKRKYSIPEDTSFHSFDLFGNKGHKLYLTDGNAINLSRSIAEFIKICPIDILLASFDKNEFRKYFLFKNNSYFIGSRERKRDKDIGYEAVATEILLAFGRLLRAKSSFGKVVAESRKNSDYVILKTYLRCQHEKAFITRRLTSNANDFSERTTGITFENKKGLSGGLQIADIVSYVANISLKKGLSKNTHRGIPIIWDALRSKLERKEIKKISGIQYSHLLSPARVNKITNFNKK